MKSIEQSAVYNQNLQHQYNVLIIICRKQHLKTSNKYFLHFDMNFYGFKWERKVSVSFILLNKWTILVQRM